MNPAFKVPPESKTQLTSPRELVNRLGKLIGAPFELTGKTRTDGSKLRNLVCDILGRYPLAPPAEDYRIAPPKKKGVPKILRELLDSYIVTTGSTYNLQVWNRIPAAPSVLVEYPKGEPLLTTDVRYVLIKIDPIVQQIAAIAILTPDYIERRFGKFGKPTIKHQLIISSKERNVILASKPPILFHPDLPNVAPMTSRRARVSKHSMHDEPQSGFVLSLNTIAEVTNRSLLGATVGKSATKNRGQILEEMVARALGYRPEAGALLAGGYPDIRHQALEVKIQDAPTVDLGRFSPQLDEEVLSCPGFTTGSIRYLIALTNPASGVIHGAVVCPGIILGEHFTFVAETSFKCQRSIPMSFFDELEGRVVFNP